MHGWIICIFDRLIPCPGRRVTWSRSIFSVVSHKPPGYPYTAMNQLLDLDAVIKQRSLGQVILVAHDASGPPAIDWALNNSGRVDALVLLNTYYCEMPTLRPPEAIRLFSTPVIRNVARFISGLFNHWAFRRMYWWQVGRFFRDAEVRDEFVPLLYRQFDAVPSARPAFYSLNEDLLPTVRSRSKMIPRLKEFRRSVRIIFGDADPYLNKGVAQTFHESFHFRLVLLPEARHFVQMDSRSRLRFFLPVAEANGKSCRSKPHRIINLSPFIVVNKLLNIIERVQN
jgi:pimeloyl-ACP methyl ester carboxylesterase